MPPSLVQPLARCFGFEPHTTVTYAFALGFTFTGTVVFPLGRFRDRRVPREAIIGSCGVLPDLLLDLAVDLLGVLR